MLTTALDHLAWGALAATQALSYPFGVAIAAQNLTNGLATSFTGPVALSAYATGLAAAATIIGNLGANSALAGSQMTHGYAFTPNTNVLVTAVRSYSSDQVSIWTDGGTLLGSQSTSSSGSWVETAMATPVMLTAGTTYRVGARIPAGVNGYFRTASWPSTFANGTVGQNFYWSYGDVFPTSVYGTSQGPLVDLRYSVAFSNSIPVSPTSSGAFANGVWNGNITISQAATNIVLKADDGAGHTALSSPLNVVASLALLSPRRPTANQFQCTVVGPAGQHVHILTSSNLVTWTTNVTVVNTTGSYPYTDNSASPSKRFYRARQAP